MILIVEGADLVGKSTLAERVSTAYGWSIAKIRWGLLGDPAAETRGMASATLAMLQALKPDIIFDRIYFSWWAYGPALDHDVSYMPELIRRFSSVGDARLVLLTTSAAELAARYERQPDLYFSLGVIQQANARFPSLLPLLPSSLPALHIDTTAVSADEVFARVQTFISTEIATELDGA